MQRDDDYEEEEHIKMIWHGCLYDDGDDDDDGCDNDYDDANMDEGQIYLFCYIFLLLC